MKNLNVLKNKLLNRVPLNIFSYLTKVPHTSHYEREIARAVESSIGATNQTLKILLNIGVVIREKKGQLYLYRLSLDSPLVREYRKFENILDVVLLVSKIKGFCNKIVLYGSCASGTDTTESDIDLFIISREKERILREIRKYGKNLNREIKPFIVTIEEYLRLRKNNEPIIEEIDGGIVLYEKKR